MWCIFKHNPGLRKLELMAFKTSEDGKGNNRTHPKCTLTDLLFHFSLLINEQVHKNVLKLLSSCFFWVIKVRLQN